VQSLHSPLEARTTRQPSTARNPPGRVPQDQCLHP
jgi:hypothetical protein